jgi:addiction module HigA family antidote
MLREEFLAPLKISQSEFARAAGVSFPRLNEVVRGHRPVTVDTALRFAQVLGTSPELWLNLQLGWDLWHAAHSAEGKAIAKLEPIAAGG